MGYIGEEKEGIQCIVCTTTLGRYSLVDITPEILNRVISQSSYTIFFQLEMECSIEITFFLGPAPDLNIPCLAFSKRLLPRDHHSNPMQMTSIISFP